MQNKSGKTLSFKSNNQNPFLYSLNKKSDLTEKLILLSSGIVVGLINGLFGGGGGMLVVPVLTFLVKKPIKIAHATAILIILPISLASAVVYLLSGRFELFNGLTVGGGVILGGITGALLLGKLNPKVTGLIFSILMLVAGVRSAFF